ncbi:MAG TPA: hypothetical protein VIF43_03010 [Patescibacteria group bacterium]|jgi:hypothetical protein
MASEVARVEGVEPGGKKGVRAWLRERFPLRSDHEMATERAVAEAVKDSEFVGPYPRSVSDAVITGLEQGLPLPDEAHLKGKQATGFACERRPTMILVGDPLAPNLVVYRIEIQETVDRCKEVELTIAGEGDQRQVVEATAWFEQHLLGQQQAVPLGLPLPMESMDLLKLAADLEGRVRDGTSIPVQGTAEQRVNIHHVAPRLSADGPETDARLDP